MGFALVAMLLVAQATELPFLNQRRTSEHVFTAGGSRYQQCQEELSRCESRESRYESRCESCLARERESVTKAATPVQGSAVAHAAALLAIQSPTTFCCPNQGIK